MEAYNKYLEEKINEITRNSADVLTNLIPDLLVDQVIASKNEHIDVLNKRIQQLETVGGGDKALAVRCKELENEVRKQKAFVDNAKKETAILEQAINEYWRKLSSENDAKCAQLEAALEEKWALSTGKLSQHQYMNRENTLFFHEDFSSWVAVGAELWRNSTWVIPDPEKNEMGSASRLLETDVNEVHGLYLGVNETVNGTFRFQFMAKPFNGRGACIWIGSQDHSNLIEGVFDLKSGKISSRRNVGNSKILKSSISNIFGGWYLITMEFQISSNGPFKIQINTRDISNKSSTFKGGVNFGVDLWGASLAKL